jgi:hypothetical protein
MLSADCYFDKTPCSVPSILITGSRWELAMVRFQCDGCGKLREGKEAWILGLAAENIGITSARREISIVSAWERAHCGRFPCSPDKCRAYYMSELFGESPETLQGETTVTRRRVKRVIPGAVVETVVSEKARPTIVRRTRKPKRTA